MIPINWTPDRKVLGEFAEAGMFALGMVAAPLAAYRGQSLLAVAFWVVAVSIKIVGLARSEWLKPIYLGLILATWPIGWVVSRLALSVLYFAIFTPIALAFRLVGRDNLRRSFDRKATSYWEIYQPNRGLERYLRPF